MLRYVIRDYKGEYYSEFYNGFKGIGNATFFEDKEDALISLRALLVNMDGDLPLFLNECYIN